MVDDRERVVARPRERAIDGAGIGPLDERRRKRIARDGVRRRHLADALAVDAVADDEQPPARRHGRRDHRLHHRRPAARQQH